MNFNQLIARHLLQIKAIIVNPNEPFTWASGLQSPIYCDNRRTLSYPHVRNDLVDAMVEKTGEFPKADIIAGVATAGIPHGALLAHHLGLPFIYVRSKAKEHGRRNQIEGEIAAGKRVLVVEDLISTGKSSKAAIEAIEAAEMQVTGLLAIFTYQLAASNIAFREENYPVKAITNLETLLEVAEQEGLIDRADFSTLDEWRLDPLKWSEKSKKLNPISN